MAGETIITVVGNLVDDPELRFTPSGAAVANFRIASTPRVFDKQTNEFKDGEALFLSCSIWRQAAEHVAESLTKGMRVVVQGQLKQRTYEDREGQKRTVFELEVDEIGPSLRYATAKVTRTPSQGGGQQRSQQGGGYQQQPTGGAWNQQQAPTQQQPQQQNPGGDPWNQQQSNGAPWPTTQQPGQGQPQQQGYGATHQGVGGDEPPF